MLNWHYISYIWIALIILLSGVLFFLWSQHRKTKLRLIAGEFGSNVSVKGGLFSYDIEFEREGTVYKSSVHDTAYILNFYLPQVNEKLFIRQNSPIARLRTEVDESRFSPSVPVPGLSDNYLVLSPNHEFAKEFLSNKAILEEINTIDAVFNYPQISYDNGHFRIKLISTGWNSLKKFRHMCRVAIFLHDDIRRYHNSP